jgi:predicted nucleic acid-binding protein
MGVILGSSVLIAAELQGKNARQVLISIAEEIGETEAGISAVTLIELAHEAARADTPERRARRENFIEELLPGMPACVVNVSIALRAGKIGGENQAQGLRVPLPDLLMGVTERERPGVAERRARWHEQLPAGDSMPSIGYGWSSPGKFKEA